MVLKWFSQSKQRLQRKAFLNRQYYFGAGLSLLSLLYWSWHWCLRVRPYSSRHVGEWTHCTCWGRVWLNFTSCRVNFFFFLNYMRQCTLGEYGCVPSRCMWVILKELSAQDRSQQENTFKFRLGWNLSSRDRLKEEVQDELRTQSIPGATKTSWNSAFAIPLFTQGIFSPRKN